MAVFSRSGSQNHYIESWAHVLAITAVCRVALPRQVFILYILLSFPYLPSTSVAPLQCVTGKQGVETFSRFSIYFARPIATEKCYQNRRSMHGTCFKEIKLLKQTALVRNYLPNIPPAAKIAAVCRPSCLTERQYETKCSNT